MRSGEKRGDVAEEEELGGSGWVWAIRGAVVLGEVGGVGSGFCG